MAFNYDEYLRTDKMPPLWCWGCGDGVILKALIRAIDKLGWNMDDVCVVSGIGCRRILLKRRLWARMLRIIKSWRKRENKYERW